MAIAAAGMLTACSDDSSSNSPAIESSSGVSTDVNSGTTPESSSVALPESSSEALPTSSSEALPESSESGPIPESSSEALPASSSSAETAPSDTVWNKAVLTWYISWPDPGSEECIVYNGCEWAGYFAGLDGQQTEEWVSEHNIISIHEKDWGKYKLKTFRLRQNGKSIDAVVYDMCSDDDCDGCCTKNADETGFLIDVESYTCERLTGSKEGCDGIVEWTCLNCE